MKKAFDQTVRELKREVNKKVLKVPTIEQKVLDATSNEPWGPHGTLLSDIAHASKNHYEYQMILTVIWKRMNDTGKNWRHVYKALTVLEYLVANGSERVIDEIREHAYQISTLSSFQYIDSKGRDQGNNVRRKSQSLVVLANDNDRVSEVRQKAAANREKFRSISSTGGMYRPRSYSDFEGYGGKQDEYRYEDRYRSSDYDRDGYGGRNGREWSRDDDRYRYGDSHSYSGEKYGRDYEDRFGRDAYRDDSYRGRSRSIDASQYDSRGKSSERESDHGFDDVGRHSSQRLDRKFSEQNLSMPQRYEEAVSESRSPDERAKDTENAATPTPKSPSPLPPSSNTGAEKNVGGSSLLPKMPVIETADDFDPRGPLTGQPTSSRMTDTNLFGSFADPSSDNSLALVPVTPLTAESDLDTLEFSGSASAFSTSASASMGSKQPFEDPFGDSPFKANGGPSAPLQSVPASYPSTSGSSFPGFSSQQPSMQHYSMPDPNTDILAGILALPEPLPAATPEVISSSVINPYGAVATGPIVAPTSIPSVSNQYYGYGGMHPLVHGQSTMLPQMGPLPSSQLSAPKPPNDNFQPKSTIWADTLSRGLVDLNISGTKNNPLADIGVDFDALNRKEKRMEKIPATTTTVVSNVVMGKAMGSGSGVGRAGASSLKPPPSPMVGGSATGWGGYGGMGMSMNMGMGQGMVIQQHNMPPPGPTHMVGGYNPMRGPGGYAQQPYGGIYR